MAKKQFHVRVLLTVTTDRLLTQGKGPRDNGIGDLYELLGWMTSDSPFTHQLPRFSDECKPWLLRWFPDLEGTSSRLDRLDELLKSPDGPEAGVEQWLFEEIDGHGIQTHYDVPKIPQDDHDRKDPVDELIQMRGTDEGIVIAKTTK